MQFTIDNFHHGLNRVTKTIGKDPKKYIHQMLNCIVSPRNALQMRQGASKINSTAFNPVGSDSVASIFDYEAHLGGLLHKYIANIGDSLFEFHLGSGVGDALITGLTGTQGECQYAVAGTVLYIGNGREMLKYYPIAHHTLHADSGGTLDNSSNQRLAQSFTLDHNGGANPIISSISLPLVRQSGYSGISVYLEVYTDSGGAPGTLLETSNIIPGDSISDGYEWVPFTFSNLLASTAGLTLWIVLRANPLPGVGDVLVWAIDTDNQYSGGNWATYNGSSWSSVAGSDGLFAVYTKPQKWGIEAPTTKPTLSASTTVEVAKYQAGGDAGYALTNSSVGNLAQSFKVAEATNIGTVQLRLKQLGTTSGNLTVSIQGDVTGVPDGTAISTSGEILAALGGTFDWVVFEFDEPVELSADTTYWLVLEGDSEYDGSYNAGVDEVQWRADATSPAYDDGNLATYSGGAWSADASVDLLFIVRAISNFRLGGRSYAVSFGNSLTGHVSNRGPVTPRSGNTTSQTIELSDIPVSSDTQVDQRIIWATTDGGGNYFYWRTINDNVTTSLTGDDADDADDDALDVTREAPIDNYPPPNGFLVDKFRGVICVAGVETSPRYMYASASLGQSFEGVAEESFPAFNFWSVPSGAERIMTMSQLDDVPVLFAPDEIFLVSGTDPESFIVTQFRGGKNIGSSSRKGAVATEKGLFFFSTDKKVYVLPTVTHVPTLVSGVIEDDLETIANDSAIDQILMEGVRMNYINYGDMHWVLLAAPFGQTGGNFDLYIYDLDLHDVHPGQGWFGPQRLSSGVDPFDSISIVSTNKREKKMLVGSKGGYIWQFNVEDSYLDDGSIYSSYAEFPLNDLGFKGVKDLLTVSVLVPETGSLPSSFLQIAFEAAYTFQNVTLHRVDEMEFNSGQNGHYYRGYIMKQAERVAFKINFLDSSPELWQIEVDFEPLYEMSGFINQ